MAKEELPIFQRKSNENSWFVATELKSRNPSYKITLKEGRTYRQDSLELLGYSFKILLALYEARDIIPSARNTGINPVDLVNSMKSNNIDFAVDLVSNKKEKMDAFAKIVEDVAEKQKEPLALPAGALNINNYIENTEKLWTLQPFYYDDSKIYWFWSMTDNVWEMVDEVNIMNALDDTLGFQGQTVSSKMKNNYLEAIRRVGRKRKPKDLPETWVQFKNTIIDFKTGDRLTPSPEYFSTNPIPWNYVEDQPTPILDELFKDWVGDTKAIMLKEIMAWTIVPRYYPHKIFCFIGAGMNGKSTYMNVLQKYVDSKNCCSSDLDQLMANRFEQAALYKKLVCMMGETNFNTMTRTDKLKKLSGEDPISFEIKNKNPFTGKNYAKLLISTNGLPQTSDNTDGFHRRWVNIIFPKSYEGKDRDIMAEIPDSEYEALTGQCIKLLKELYIKKIFTSEGTTAEKKEIYENYSNPLKKFLEEYTEENADDHVFKYDVRDRFKIWAKHNGHREWSEKEVSLYMKERRFDEKRIENPLTRTRIWAYVGLKFKEDIKRIKTPKKKILEYIKDNDKGEGVSAHTIIKMFKSETGIKKLLVEGEIYEKTPGMLRLMP